MMTVVVGVPCSAENVHILYMGNGAGSNRKVIDKDEKTKYNKTSYR